VFKNWTNVLVRFPISSCSAWKVLCENRCTSEDCSCLCDSCDCVLTFSLKNMLRVAAWQMCSRGSVEQCKLSVLRGVAAASRARADVVTFPENSLGLGCSDARPWNVEKGELAWLGEVKTSSNVILFASFFTVFQAALEHNIDICLGVIEDTARSRPSNSLVWFGADGAVKVANFVCCLYFCSSKNQECLSQNSFV
jgi:hypothetical protein